MGSAGEEAALESVDDVADGEESSLLDVAASTEKNEMFACVAADCDGVGDGDGNTEGDTPAAQDEDGDLGGDVEDVEVFESSSYSMSSSFCQESFQLTKVKPSRPRFKTA